MKKIILYLLQFCLRCFKLFEIDYCTIDKKLDQSFVCRRLIAYFSSIIPTYIEVFM